MELQAAVGYRAVGTRWGSVDVVVQGTRLGSEYAAVDVHIAPDEYDAFPATFDVTVTGNRIASGTLPDGDPTLNIVVRDNRVRVSGPTRLARPPSP